MRVAIIDLGTNTFHLLIVKIENDGRFSTLKRIRKYVYIGEDGVETLGEKPLQRAYETLAIYQETILEYQVEKVTAFGTAALRRASNGKDFIKKVKNEIGITIQIISGDREANLIYLGTKRAIPLTMDNILIMDIGGGSVEFIIANQSQKIWARSFPIGVSVLFNSFHKSEPISSAETNKLLDFLNNQLEPLYKALQQYPAYILVGASGTFDVISGVMGTKIANYPNAENVDLTNFPTFYKTIVEADLEQRLTMKDIPKQRAKLISVALILVNLLIKKAKINKMIVSSYAMKEGIITEIVNEQ
ncbi:MAG: hypothetical protein AB8G11_04290 [Saprospiraceae bacterium]